MFELLVNVYSDLQNESETMKDLLPGDIIGIGLVTYTPQHILDSNGIHDDEGHYKLSIATDTKGNKYYSSAIVVRPCYRLKLQLRTVQTRYKIVNAIDTIPLNDVDPCVDGYFKRDCIRSELIPETLHEDYRNAQYGLLRPKFTIEEMLVSENKWIAHAGALRFKHLEKHGGKLVRKHPTIR